MSVVDWAQVAAGFAAAVAAGIAAWQLKVTKDQIDRTVRPFVGTAEPPLYLDLNDRRFYYHFENRGSVPAEDVKVRLIASNIIFTREQLVEQAKFGEEKSTVLFPGSKQHQAVMFEEAMYRQLQDHQIAYVGARISYKYGKSSSAQFGTILEYNTHENKPSIIKEWIEKG